MKFEALAVLRLTTKSAVGAVQWELQLALRLLGLGQQSRRPVANAQIAFGKKYDVKDQHLEDMRHRLIAKLLAKLPTIAHPITLSAATNRAGEIERPSALAVSLLITRSTFLSSIATSPWVSCDLDCPTSQEPQLSR